LERGKHLKSNQKKLDLVTNSQWVKALKKCKEHVIKRLKKRTLFGTHTEERLGTDPIDYYVNFAVDAVLDGNWEWKDGRSLGEQFVRIADNRIGKEVEKYNTEDDDKFSMAGDEIDELFYESDLPPDKPTIIQEAVFAKKISVIEEAIKGDANLEMFWDCVKEGMKRNEIAAFFEKHPRQIDKLREKLILKTKSSPHFQ
jgi:RNA binding exosome subunit